MVPGPCWTLFSLLLSTAAGVSAPTRSNGNKGSFLLKGEDVSRGALAAELAWIANREGVRDTARTEGGTTRTGIYLESGTDAVYLARVGDSYCAAAFMGTQGYPPSDWWTNLELDPVVFRSNNNDDDDDDESSPSSVSENDGSCDVHGGYHRAYASFEHKDAVESFLKDCKAACENCEVVLTGHSQGGGIAAVAALYLKHQTTKNSDIDIDIDIDIEEEQEALSRTNSGANATANATTIANHHIPYVITFGAPSSLGAGCQSLFSEEERRRWFRYVMSAENRISGSKRVYDPVPLLYSLLLDPQGEQDGEEENSDNNNNDEIESWFDDGLFGISLPTDETYARSGGLAYIGYEILLSAEDPSSVLLTGFDSHRFVNPEYIDLSGRTHQDYLYLEVLRAQDDLYQKQQQQATNESSDGAVGDTGCPEQDFASSGNTTESPEHGGGVSQAWCLPSGGFAEGSLCNPNESSSPPIATSSNSTCAEGLACEPQEEEEEGWWWSWWFGGSARHTCRPRAEQAHAVPSPETTAAAPRDAGGIGEESAESKAQEESRAVSAATTDPSSGAATNRSTPLGALSWTVAFLFWP